MHRNLTSFYRKMYATVVPSKTGSMMRVESVAVDSSLKKAIDAFGAVSEERQLKAAPSGSGGQATLVIRPGLRYPSDISSNETSTDEYNVPSAPTSETFGKDQLESIDPALGDCEMWLTSQTSCPATDLFNTRRSFDINDTSVSDAEAGSSPSDVYELRDLSVAARIQEGLLKMHVDVVDEQVVHSGARKSELTSATMATTTRSPYLAPVFNGLVTRHKKLKPVACLGMWPSMVMLLSRLARPV